MIDGGKQRKSGEGFVRVVVRQTIFFDKQISMAPLRRFSFNLRLRS